MKNPDSFNPKWEVGDVEPVILPEETYGICSKRTCKNVGELGNGMCQKCWDKGGGKYSRLSKNDKNLEDLPEINIPIGKQVLMCNPFIGV